MRHQLHFLQNIFGILHLLQYLCKIFTNLNMADRQMPFCIYADNDLQNTKITL